MRKDNRSICFMCYRFTMGYGVDLVVARHVDHFLSQGWKVGVIFFMKDEYYLERYRKEINKKQLCLYEVKPNDLEEVLKIVHQINFDAAVVHTPPFFSALEAFPKGMVKIMMDYGEPPAHLFPDREEREKLHQNKILWAAHADKVVCISRFIQQDSGIHNAHVILIGNDHLLKPENVLNSLKGNFQKHLSNPEAFIVLNVTRFHRGERLYKGLNEYLAVKKIFFRKYPDLQNKVLFLLAGKSSERDLEWAKGEGLEAFSNLSENELISAYLDSHFYLSTSQWEGFNLGLGQALSFGLDCAASDKGAHSELGVFVSNDPEILAREIHESYERYNREPLEWKKRLSKAVLFPWKESAIRFEELINEIIPDIRNL